MNWLTALPLGDTSNTTMYVLAGVAAACVIALLSMWLLPKKSEKKADDEQSHVEEISEE